MRIEAAITDVRPDPTIDALRDKIARLEADTGRLEAECDRLRWFVGHDELTGLPNRRLFSSLAPARLHASPTAVVLLMDLNGFKPINDAYGHEVGDRVLQVIAERLSERIENGLIARLGGDEFVGVLTPATSTYPETWWKPKVAGLLDTIAAPMTIARRRMSVTASIGVAVTDSMTAIGDLMHHADMAMYEAKIHGLGFQTWQPATAPAAAPVPPHRNEAAQLTAKRRVAATAPVIDPYKRDPSEVTPAGTYQRADPVWVFRHGAWHPGVVESASRRAVMATYRRNATAGTVVDTMGPECVLQRADADPQLDEIHATQLRPIVA